MVGLNEGLRPDDPYNRHAHAPWWIVQSDDKKAAPINCPHHLQSIPYEGVR
jgi:polyphosphate kinase 2 (PPK2 family)